MPHSNATFQSHHVISVSNYNQSQGLGSLGHRKTVSSSIERFYLCRPGSSTNSMNTKHLQKLIPQRIGRLRISPGHQLTVNSDSPNLLPRPLDHLGPLVAQR